MQQANFLVYSSLVYSLTVYSLTVLQVLNLQNSNYSIPISFSRRSVCPHLSMRYTM